MPSDTCAQSFGIPGERCTGRIVVQPDLELVDGGSIDAAELGDFSKTQPLPLALGAQGGDQWLERPVRGPSSRRRLASW